MSTILPLGETPINSFHHHAFPLLISALHPYFNDWFNCNYIQLYSKKSESESFAVNYYEFDRLGMKTPFIAECYTKRSIISKYVNPVQFVKDSISNNQYVMTFLDEYYLPDRWAYQKIHFIHDTLIYGFDDERGVVHIAGFDATRTFTFTEVDMRDFEQAYSTTEQGVGPIVIHADGIHSYELKLDRTYTFDLSIIIEMMEDYLYSRNTSERFRMYYDPVDHIYGLNTYDSVIDYLTNSGNEMIDTKVLHVIYEHKKTMTSRLRYLQEEKGIAVDPWVIEQYSLIEELSFKTRASALKYEITMSPSLLSKMVDELRKMREMEQAVLERLIPQLKQQLPKSSQQVTVLTSS
ncbi:hypothetical protein [Paenibacillus xylaniclasticus]|uniref:hypothetical protein n=1 Tax=Paenibacillus xylaniclasticus TaxID=588083 RepID=UPI000FD9E096|nr:MULTISPECIES: hypothetical protein [Paenibacillus]GFN29884.1 hypothetical protein PCURB6_01440 [Paenibacillus curdlanolyticus]